MFHYLILKAGNLTSVQKLVMMKYYYKFFFTLSYFLLKGQAGWIQPACSVLVLPYKLYFYTVTLIAHGLVHQRISLS